MSYKNNKAWRKRNNATWQKEKRKYYKQFEVGASNSHQRYTIREEDMIINKKYPDRVIARKIGRSIKAIQVRRARLNNFKNIKNIV